MTSWLGPRSTDGGLDEIPMPQEGGRLWICGKHLVGPDPEAALVRAANATVIVCLNERHELSNRYPDYVDWLDGESKKPEGRALWFSTPDLHAPDLERAQTMLTAIQNRLSKEQGVIIHCGAGIGRAPTLAVLLLMKQGLDEQAALALVAARRPMAGPESGAQASLVSEFAGLVNTP